MSIDAQVWMVYRSSDGALRAVVISRYHEGMEPTSTQAARAESETATVPVIAEHIGIRPGFCGGEPHILGHRIKVRHVAVWHEQNELSPAEIVANHPSITLAQVHAALAYYYDHRAEID